MNSSANPEQDNLAHCALDRHALAKLRELDPDGRLDVVPRVLRTYAQSLARTLPTIAQVQARADLAQVRLLAHMLKSSSASVGALALSTLCARAEEQARQTQSVDLATTIAQLIDEGWRVHAAVQAMLRG